MAEMGRDRKQQESKIPGRWGLETVFALRVSDSWRWVSLGCKAAEAGKNTWAGAGGKAGLEAPLPFGPLKGNTQGWTRRYPALLAVLPASPLTLGGRENRQRLSWEFLSGSSTDSHLVLECTRPHDPPKLQPKISLKVFPVRNAPRSLSEANKSF